MWGKLNKEQIAEFKKWARDNYLYMTPINSTWHPVCQKECLLMNLEDIEETVLELTE